MVSLREKVTSGMTTEECCDVLYQLYNYIENGFAFLGPDGIFLDDDNTVYLHKLNRIDLSVAAPEVLQAELENKEINIGKEQGLFTLGMLAYFMFNRIDYYSSTNTSALELILNNCQQLANRDSVICPHRIKGIPFEQTVISLTSFDAQKRILGIPHFLSYVQKKMYSKAIVNFVYHGKIVTTIYRDISEPISNLVPAGYLNKNGYNYLPFSKPISIPFRPGTHTYQIPVKKIEDNTPEYWLLTSKRYFTGINEDADKLVKILKLSNIDSSNVLTFSVREQTFNLFLSQCFPNEKWKIIKTIPIQISSADCTVRVEYNAVYRTLIIYAIFNDFPNTNKSFTQTIKLYELT